MIDLRAREVWFRTGSQHLYGPETLAQVARQASEIVAALADDGCIPVTLKHRNVLTTADAIEAACREANAAAACIGVITWMHTFSPAKMWIAGLNALEKPLLHLHTQHNRELPWGEIDMDFMNLNQAAHGDREFAFVATRLRHRRKTVVGHWSDEAVDVETLEDFAEIAGIELLTIGADTSAHQFRNEIRWNQVYYHLAGGL